MRPLGQRKQKNKSKIIIRRIALGFGCPLPSLQSSAHWRENTVLSMKPIPSFIILNYTKHVGCPKLSSTQAKKVRRALKLRIIGVNLGTLFWGSELRWEQAANGFRLMATSQDPQPGRSKVIGHLHTQWKSTLKVDFLWTFQLASSFT